MDADGGNQTNLTNSSADDFETHLVAGTVTFEPARTLDSEQQGHGVALRVFTLVYCGGGGMMGGLSSVRPVLVLAACCALVGASGCGFGAPGPSGGGTRTGATLHGDVWSSSDGDKEALVALRGPACARVGDAAPDDRDS